MIELLELSNEGEDHFFNSFLKPHFTNTFSKQEGIVLLLECGKTKDTKLPSILLFRSPLASVGVSVQQMQNKWIFFTSVKAAAVVVAVSVAVR